MRQNNQHSSNDDQNRNRDRHIGKLFHSVFKQNDTIICDKCHADYVFEKNSQQTVGKSKRPVCPHCVGKPEPYSMERVRLEKMKLGIGWKVASARAREWWAAIEIGQRGELALLINLASQLSQRGSSIEELYLAFCQFKTTPMVALLLYMEFLRGRLADLTGADFEENWLPNIEIDNDHSKLTSERVSEVSPGISNTRGWTEDRLRTSLDQVRQSLDFQNATEAAVRWWQAFEDENKTRPALILRLAQELAIRKATLSEFHLTFVHSGVSNIQANLHLLDFNRLKQEEVKKRRDAAKSQMDDQTFTRCRNCLSLVPTQSIGKHLCVDSSKVEPILDINAIRGFGVVLTSFGDRKLNVVKLVKFATGLSLMDAKRLVESAPTAIGRAPTKDEAAKVVGEIHDAGGQAHIA